MKLFQKMNSKIFDLGFSKTKALGSNDFPESGWTYDNAPEKKRGCSLCTWMIIALPLITFLSLGAYFIAADVKLLTTVVEKQMLNASEASLQETPPKIDPPDDEEDPNLIVRFDYVDLAAEDIPADGHFIENIFASGNHSKETLIILKNDDSGKKIFLKTSLPDFVGEEEEVIVKEKMTVTTTPKAFVYSPTIPHATPKKQRLDSTTKKYNHTEDSGCFSTKLPFCEGILPYDVVQLPTLPGVKRYSDLAAVLPYFQMIVDSGCSLRAREFICSVLEPECRPEGQTILPCKLHCKVVSDDCKDYVLETLALSKIFDCRRYPDWDENEDCLNVSKGECHSDEFRCADGTCIPLKWVCDGVHDCPGSRPGFDESNCQGCSKNEFRCVMDGKCVPAHWKCDGQIDCTDHSDEMSC